MNVPGHLRYTADHEWVEIVDRRARIGITDYAQDALGDVVYVALPSVGSTVARPAAVGEVESTKSVSEIYAPVDGSIVAVNERLASEPELLNADPYGEGWICEIELGTSELPEGLLDAETYKGLVGG
jgi:glycine cleavage system H protein